MEKKFIKDIIAHFPVLKFTGKTDYCIEQVVELQFLNTNEKAIAWCNSKNLDFLNEINKGTVICPLLPESFDKKNEVNYIETENPRQYFMSVLKFLHPDDSIYGVSGSAKIFKDVSLGNNISIGENVVIESGSVIGDNTKIGHNTVLLRNTIIGKNVVIGSNNTIGGIGFGYQKNNEGIYEALPHIGNVIIEDNVEIGNNVCIDRAVLSSTIIRKNVKIDNQVHIAHNVIIDENSLIIANSMIGGSTTIGKEVWVAPSSSLINKITVGDEAIIGMGSVVIKNVENGSVIAGNPGRVLRKKDDQS